MTVLDAISHRDATAASDSGAAELRDTEISLPRPAAIRAGYLPVPLERVLIDALRSIPVYLQNSVRTGGAFTLYCAPNGRFTENHRRRLYSGGIKFIFIPTTHHALLQSQMEEELETMAGDPDLATNTKSAIVYETSLELINEVLAEQAVGRSIPRLEKVSRAVSTLVIQNSEAFPHLFATAQHDFYTATHMVNVGTWMTSLAFALGERDPKTLTSICTAGMLHDVGKMDVPDWVLNKKGPLSSDEWAMLRRHPVSGYEYLRAQGVDDEIVLRVALEHHERMDGSGYPYGKKEQDIHRISRICATVDSFDSMTALRPFQNQPKSISQALGILYRETPEKYDPCIFKAWDNLMSTAPHDSDKPRAALPRPEKKEPEIIRLGRRAFERFGIDCPLELHLLRPVPDGWHEGKAAQAHAENISRGGLGLLTTAELAVGGYIRILLRGRGTLANRLLEGKVVRCEKQDDGKHAVGMKFCELPAEK